MINEENLGVFELITKLCEKFYSKPDKIKKARSECYELLLGKRVSTLQQKYKDLRGTKDPVCNLIAWQYTLSHDYRMPQEAKRIGEISTELEEIYSQSKKLDTYHNILTFLMCLRDIPIRKDDSTDLSYLPIYKMPNFTEMFKLPKHMLEGTLEYNNNLFQMDKSKMKKSSKTTTCYCSAMSICEEFNTIKNLENESLSFEDDKEENIWALAAREPYRPYRNWESYGYPEPDKEPPFMSELGDLSSLWVETIQVTEAKILGKVAFKADVKSLKDFIKDAKYLLVGIASESFTYIRNGNFAVIPAISLPGIREKVFVNFCEELVLSGDCYRYLNKLSELDWYMKPIDHESVILRALRKEIATYLSYYRTHIMKIPETTPPAVFQIETKEIRDQINTVTCVLRNGIENYPTGVSLINYLFEEFSKQMDPKISQLLYRFLAPCIQAYFQHFISQWVLHGVINDPHNDFFVKINTKNVASKNRLMWTQSFSIQNNQVPFFLSDLKDDILQCGKIMCLLKISQKFDLYFMGEKPEILHPCVTSEQYKFLEYNVNTYDLEVLKSSGAKFSLARVLEQQKGFNEEFLNTIAQKRLATLKRIELERRVQAEKRREKKIEEQQFLKRQYDMAIEYKQMEKIKELESEIKLLEAGINVDKRIEVLMSEEAADMIGYYERLNKIADERKAFAEKLVLKLKQQLDLPMDQVSKTPEEVYEETYGELFSDPIDKKDLSEVETSVHQIIEENSKNLDVLNANLIEEKNEPEIIVTEVIEPVLTEVIEPALTEKIEEINRSVPLSALEEAQQNKKKVLSSDFNKKEEPKVRKISTNFTEAQKNKLKVLSSEFGMDPKEIQKKDLSSNFNKKEELKVRKISTNLTEAQKNKLKVLSSEFGMGPKEIQKKVLPINLTEAQKNKLKILRSEFDIEIDPIRTRVDKKLTICDVNKFKMMTSKVELAETLRVPRLDNENALNKNVVDNKSEDFESKKNLENLNLDFEVNDDLEQFLPMSVDSTPACTPCMELPTDQFNAPVSSFTFFQAESIPTEKESDFDLIYEKIPKAKLSDVKPILMEKFLTDSLRLTLSVHKSIIENALLKYFIEDLCYLEHLNNLKRYFFMQDGEFCRIFTDILFEKLYSVKNNPKELLNNRVLGYITQGHLTTNGIENLSFKINKIPERFDVLDVNVFKCISLTYKIKWPLNIILPHEAIIRYNSVFLFLLKISRPSWVLRKIFLDLRMLAKRAGNKESVLMLSPHYTSIQRSRYIMTQFTKSLESYVIGEVFSTHWVILEENLSKANSLDEIYQMHTKYLKNILFQCLLSEKSSPLKKVLDKILTTVLKFFYYLRGKMWNCVDGLYTHPNFDKLESITENFKELVLFFIKISKKVVRSGYQQQLQQFLNLIDINQYYSKLQESNE